MRPLHYEVRKTGKAAARDAKYIGNILVTFPSGTAGRSNSAKRSLKPKVVSDTEVRVRCFRGLWKVSCVCYQFQETQGLLDHDARPLRGRDGRVYRARFRWDAAELIKWLD